MSYAHLVCGYTITNLHKQNNLDTLADHKFHVQDLWSVLHKLTNKI